MPANRFRGQAKSVAVVPEVCSLLHARLGPRAERLFIESLAQGELAVEPLERRDLARAAAVLSKRPELGFVDATVIATAERLSVTRLATTDRRHFGSVRLERGGRLQLLPEPSTACLPPRGCGTFRGRGTRRERE